MSKSPVTTLTQVIPFPDTRFTGIHPDTLLPPPVDVRARNEASGHPDATDRNRPPPVRIPELGLIVKYGTLVKKAEVDAQCYAHQRLRGAVPVPEVIGWVEDAGQGFIYMELIDAPTLAARWNSLSEAERQAICTELRGMVGAWRGLEQDSEDPYIGAVGRGPLNDVLVRDRNNSRGPWSGGNAVQVFQDAGYIDIDGSIPILFTHDDLVPCNILVTDGPDPRVAAIIDWAQAGWYPSYWEWCKAKWVDMWPDEMDNAAQQLWREKYLPLVMDPLPEETVYYPWLRYALAHL